MIDSENYFIYGSIQLISNSGFYGYISKKEPTLTDIDVVDYDVYSVSYYRINLVGVSWLHNADVVNLTPITFTMDATIVTAPFLPQ